MLWIILIEICVLFLGGVGVYLGLVLFPATHVRDIQTTLLCAPIKRIDGFLGTYVFYAKFFFVQIAFVSDCLLIVRQAGQGTWTSLIGALCIAIIVVNSLRNQHASLKFQELCDNAQSSLALGVQLTPLHIFFFAKILSRDAFMAILCPFVVLGDTGLSQFEAANALFNLILSSIGVGEAIAATHLGDAECELGEEALNLLPYGKWAVSALKFWCICTAAAQSLTLTLIAHVYRDELLLAALVVFVWISPLAFLHAGMLRHLTRNLDEPISWFAALLDSILNPMNLAAPCFSSVFGLPQWDGAINQGNQAGYWHVAMQLLRFFLFFTLAVCINPYEVTKEIKGPLMQPSDLSYMPVFFESCVVYLWAITLPVSLMGLTMLLGNSYFRLGQLAEGISDDELYSQWGKKADDLEMPDIEPIGFLLSILFVCFDFLGRAIDQLNDFLGSLATVCTTISATVRTTTCATSSESSESESESSLLRRTSFESAAST